MFVFDTSAFINGWNDHYPPPTFMRVWEYLETQMDQGIVIAPRAVLVEIERRTDALTKWAKPQTFTDPSPEVQRRVGELQSESRGRLRSPRPERGRPVGHRARGGAPMDCSHLRRPPVLGSRTTGYTKEPKDAGHLRRAQSSMHQSSTGSRTARVSSLAKHPLQQPDPRQHLTPQIPENRAGSVVAGLVFSWCQKRVRSSPHQDRMPYLGGEADAAIERSDVGLAHQLDAVHIRELGPRENLLHKPPAEAQPTMSWSDDDIEHNRQERSIRDCACEGDQLLRRIIDQRDDHRRTLEHEGDGSIVARRCPPGMCEQRQELRKTARLDSVDGHCSQAV